MRTLFACAFLRSPTALHLVVVTLRCEHSCPYCQVHVWRTGEGHIWDARERNVEIVVRPRNAALTERAGV
jgi:pyruvate formate-lyase activating enzyme-like uncharacterized protein